MPLKDRIAVRSRSIAVVVGSLAFLLLALLAMMQVRDVRYDQRAIRSIEESNRRMLAVTRYLSHMQDVETGTRGYLATGNPEFLEPRRSALARLPALSAELQELYASKPSDLDDLRELSALRDAKIANSARQIRVRNAQGRDAAERIVAGGTGKRLMDRIRVVVRQLQNREAQQLRDTLVSVQDSKSDRQAQRFLIQFSVMLALAALVATMAWIVRKLDRSGRALTDSARRQASIFEAANDSMMLLDPDGRIESVNAAAEHLYGRHRSELVGTSSFALFADPPTLAEGSAYLRAIERGDARVSTVSQFTGRRKDGTIFESEVAITPVRLEDSLRFLAVSRDITERLRIDRMKAEFVATVSHELRTPLTSISGSLGLLNSGAAGTLPDKAARLTAIAHSNSQRLIRLVNDILDIEKIEAGKMDFTPTTLALDEFLPKVVEASAGLAAARNIQLVAASDEAGGAIIADPDRIMQVFANLLSNAIKYSPAGGTVEIRSRPLGRMWRVSIRDHGPGIPPEFRERVFEKFSQADSTDTRRVGGTGLGLAIVREIVARSNGAVSFDTEEGEGTTFHVDLPIAATPTAPFRPGPLKRPPGKASAHVLHVEDDPDTLRLVRAAVARNVAITGVQSLAEARDLLAVYAYDLVLLDLTMFDGNGADLVPDIRAAAPDSAILMFTAYDVAPDLAARVDGVLTKSRVELDQLVDMINRLLDARRPRGDAA